MTRMVPVGRSRGFDFGPSTVAVFDLDQTIYAAKGRNNNPLRRARYQAVSELLVEVLGRERVNDLVVSRRYGEFDQEKYHVVTGDNQDYVVFLAVACYMNLYEPEDILEELAKPHVTMLDIIASVLSRLEIRRGREDIDELCRMIGDVLVDARVGDPTPFKKFRYKEFTKTSDAMIIPASVQTDENPDYSERVYLTREMVEFIYFLKSRGCGVIAFSDRPIEATEPMERGEKLSLLDIPMSIAGPSIERDLESLDP
ncbi:MAG: hypothetical protein IH840_05385 [Candidatus Heimdallarchaeota archaeon]|nr:hypothetical protein [Candidatus Heimdallarchaeota archaeon]